MDATKDSRQEFTLLTAQIAAAYLSNHPLALAEVPGVISSVHAALRETVTPAAKSESPPVPKVSVKRSVTPDHLVCLEDGMRVKMLKRHLRTPTQNLSGINRLPRTKDLRRFRKDQTEPIDHCECCGCERLLEEEMRSQMVALTLGFSTVLLCACAQTPQGSFGSASAQQNAAVAAPGSVASPQSTKPDNQMAMQQPAQPAMSAHDWIVRCNQEATDKQVKRADLQEFLNNCLKQQQNPA
jgi:hypothetical protein